MRFLLPLAVILATSLSAAGQEEEGSRKLIVCSTTQLADFARQIVGDRMEVKSILAPGTDPHLYETRSGDARLVAKADLCLENGWHLEGKDWMKNLAANAGKQVVTCVEGVEPYLIKEEQDGRKVEVHDPHAWFSPRNAAVYVRNIYEAVSQIDPEHKSEYRARTALYLDQLRTLHLWIERQFNDIPPQQRILVTSHDAFNYFCKEYKFKPAAPVGWSTGAEVGGGITPERRKLVADSIRSFGVKAIFVETSVNPKLIREIAKDAGVNVGGELYSDSMGPPGSAGETYLGMMRENVLTIVEALR